MHGPRQGSRSSSRCAPEPTTSSSRRASVSPRARDEHRRDRHHRVLPRRGRAALQRRDSPPAPLGDDVRGAASSRTRRAGSASPLEVEVGAGRLLRADSRGGDDLGAQVSPAPACSGRRVGCAAAFHARRHAARRAGRTSASTTLDKLIGQRSSKELPLASEVLLVSGACRSSSCRRPRSRASRCCAPSRRRRASQSRPPSVSARRSWDSCATAASTCTRTPSASTWERNVMGRKRGKDLVKSSWRSRHT